MIGARLVDRLGLGASRRTRALASRPASASRSFSEAAPAPCRAAPSRRRCRSRLRAGARASRRPRRPASPRRGGGASNAIDDSRASRSIAARLRRDDRARSSALRIGKERLQPRAGRHAELGLARRGSRRPAGSASRSPFAASGSTRGVRLGHCATISSCSRGRRSACHSSSVMNGMNGWSMTRIWSNTQPATALVSSSTVASSPSVVAGLISSMYQSQKRVPDELVDRVRRLVEAQVGQRQVERLHASRPSRR